MILAEFFKKNGKYVGFQISGPLCYDEYGLI